MSLQAKYTEEQKAVALAYYEAAEKNLTKAARDCKIPKQTLHRWVNGGAVNEAVSRKRDIKKGEIADRLEALANALIDAAPDKLSEAGLQSVMTGIGIAVDKMQLLRNKPTAITDDAGLTDERRVDRINAILDRARARRDGQADPSV